MAVKKTISIPETLQNRLTKYQKGKQPWEQFTISQVCAEAIDKKLKEEGF